VDDDDERMEAASVARRRACIQSMHVSCIVSSQSLRTYRESGYIWRSGQTTERHACNKAVYLLHSTYMTCIRNIYVHMYTYVWCMCECDRHEHDDSMMLHTG
jgi:hypothetical protein